LAAVFALTARAMFISEPKTGNEIPAEASLDRVV
jgi:hypothetical protein